jgi:hypothetical protein
MFRRRVFLPYKKKSLAMNVPEKIYPSDELFSQELYGEVFSLANSYPREELFFEV